MSAIQQRGDSVIIAVRVVPRSSRNEVAGLLGDAVKIKLTAPPVEGKANRQLVEFLSKKLGVSRSRLSLLSGDAGRNKRVSVAGVSAEAVRKSLCLGPSNPEPKRLA